MSPTSVLQNVIQARSVPSVPQAQPNVVTTTTTPLIDPVFDPDDLDAVLGVLVENAPVAMAMFDRRMRYVLANRQWITDFGLQRSLPIVGRSQFEVFPNLHPGWRNVYDRALQGHVVRSEHDILAGPGGRTMLFRWEVRPWRKTKDAMVGGLMVTCEKFTPPPTSEAQGTEPAADTHNEAVPQPEAEAEQVIARPVPMVDTLLACSLPVLILSEAGIVEQANFAAINLLLAHGIEEGRSSAWDVIGESAERTGLQQEISAGLAQLLSCDDYTAPTITLSPSLARTPTLQWLLCRSRLTSGETSACLLAVPAPRPQVVAAPEPSVAAEKEAAAQLAHRRLEEQLTLTQNELRLLQDQEMAYHRRELRQREVFDGLPCGMIVLDERGRPAYHNAHTRDLFGRELTIGQAVEDWLLEACLDDRHREEVARLWRESIWRRQLTKVATLITADGLLKDFEFRPNPLPNGGLLVTIHDVTESCRLEEMLRSAEAKFRALLHENPMPVVLTDPSGAIFEANAAAENLLGSPKAELRRMRIDDWLDLPSAERRRAAMADASANGTSSLALSVALRIHDQAEHQPAQLRVANVFDADGRLHSSAHYLELSAQPASAPLVFPAPEPTAALSFATAPSPRVTAPAPPPVPAQGTPLLSTDAQGRIATWTPAAEGYFGFTASEAIGQGLHRLFRPSDGSGFYAELAQAASGCSVLWGWFGKAGARGQAQLTVHTLSLGGLAVRLETEPQPTLPSLEAAPTAPASQAIKLDLTVHPGTAWPSPDLPREQMLLAAAYHRIKHDLQIVSTLLSFQSSALQDPQASEALRASRTRVLAISELHQLHYDITLGQGSHFQSFAEALIARLRECYAIPASQVSSSVSIERHALPEEWLVPLALILNEAVSNVFRHAFRDGRLGKVEVTLQHSGEHFDLIVSDNGIGLSPDFEANPVGGLGHRIIGIFAGQMGGTLSLTSNPSGGTVFRLRYPIRCVDN